MKKIWKVLFSVLLAVVLTELLSTVKADEEEEIFPNENDVPIDTNSHDWNTLSYDQERIVSFEEFQYTGYWDEDNYLNIARRNINTDEIQTVKFADEKLSDPDNTHLNVVLGISPSDGRLHLSYNMHGSDTINYRYSDADFLTNPPEEIDFNQFSENTNILDENSITYPRFFNDQSDNLYLMIRQGGSGSGDQYLYKHSANDNSWDSVGKIFSGEGEWKDSTSRNAYLQNLIFDDDDRLHVTWVYREDAYSHSTNHGLYYAYSDDYGETWKNNNGEMIADVKNDESIQVDDEGIEVINIPQNSWVLNQGSMTLDSDGQPHLLMSQSDKITDSVPDTNVVYMHYWRDQSGQWKKDRIMDTENTVGTGPNWTEIFNYRGDIAMDLNDNIIVTLPMPDNTLNVAYSNSSGWEDWYVSTLSNPDEKVTFSGQRYDRNRWENEGVLSIPMTLETEKGTSYKVRDFQYASPAHMKKLVQFFIKDEEIDNDVARTLETHLKAVKHFEDIGKEDKLIKHTKSFKSLLKHNRTNNLISDKAYEALKGEANQLIKQYEK